MGKVNSSYPVIHCTAMGHEYEKFMVAVGNKHVFDFAGEIRVCRNCHKTQIHVQGVWVEAPKQERTPEQPKPIDPNQLTFFE